MRERIKNPPIADGRFGSKQGFTRRTSINRPLEPRRRDRMPMPGPVPITRTARDLRIAVVVTAYHEEILAQCLLKHYWFANSIFAIVGESPDRTEAIIRSDPRAVVSILNMPDGFRDDTKANAQNDVLRREQANFDWFFVVDMDEFIFPAGSPTCGVMRDWLTQVPSDHSAINCYLSNVYRHRSDSDLDLTFTSAPPILQRRHGTLQPLPGYVKPNVIRPGVEIELGHHSTRNGRAGKWTLRGAHWAWADASFSISRTVDDRTNRQHPDQYKHNWGNGNYGQTYEKVRHELARHLDDPQII